MNIYKLIILSVLISFNNLIISSDIIDRKIVEYILLKNYRNYNSITGLPQN